MYYSIYPKLRAIYSFLPTYNEIESLIESKGLSGFNSKIGELYILKRFPLMDNNIEKYFKNIPFNLTKIVYNRLSGSPKDFFGSYYRIYELKDIKSALHGWRGNYLLFIEKDEFTLSEINQSLGDGFWWDAWSKGYSRFSDTGKIFDIEVSLDHYFYKNLLKDSYKLPDIDKEETKELILEWINFINKVWIYRLKKYYNIESFEIRRFLIPEGDVFNNIERTDGINNLLMMNEFSKVCYKDFKMRMFSMRAIIAFFILLDFKIEKIISIYNAKLLNIEEMKIRQLTGIL